MTQNRSKPASSAAIEMRTIAPCDPKVLRVGAMDSTRIDFG
jgi:hypothetical protein